MALDPYVNSRRQQHSMTSEEQSRNSNSFLKETIRSGALYALAKTTMQKTGLLSSKRGKSAGFMALAVATGIGLATNEDTDPIVTVAGAVAFGVGKRGAKKFAFDKVGDIHKSVSKLNHHLGEWSQNKTEMVQRFKEYNRRQGTNPFTSPASFFSSGEYRKKSDAWQDYQSNKDRYKNLYYSKTESLGGANKKYIETMIKRESDGVGFFKEMLRYSQYDSGKDLVKFDTKKLFEKGTDVGNIKSYYNANYGELRKAMNKEDFNFDTFLKDKSEKRNATQFDKDFYEYYKGLTSEKSATGVSISDLDAQQGGILDDLAKKFGIASESKSESRMMVQKLLGDVELRKLGKDKNGRIFDKSILDPMAIAIDTMDLIEKNVRPVFSFLPGVRASSFSVIPFDLKGMKQRRGKSNFSIFEAAENIDESIDSLNNLQRRINMSGTIESRNIGSQENIDRINAQINIKLDELNDYRKNYGSTRGSVIPDDNFVAKGLNYKINDKLELTEVPHGIIGGFKTEAGVVNYLTNNSKRFKQLEGLYDISYDRILKENQFRAMGQYTSDTFTGYGAMHSDEYYYGDTVKSKFADAAKQMGDSYILRNATGRPKSSQVFNEELKDFVGRMDQKKDNFYTNLANTYLNNNDLLSDFGISQGTVNVSDVEDIKKFLSGRSTTELREKMNNLGMNVDEDILRVINTEKSVKSFFGIHSNSLNDIQNKEYMEDAIRENFVSRLLKSGLGEDVIDGQKATGRISEDFLAGYKELTEDYFKSQFIRQPIPSAKATIVRKTGSRGASKVLDDLNFSDRIGTTSGAYLNEMFNKMNQSLNYLGVRKLDELFGSEGVSPNISKVSDNFFQIMTKRVAPLILGAYALQGLEGFTDIISPGDSGLIGATAGTYAAMRIGFQVMMEYTGVQGAARYMAENGLGGLIEPLELNLSSDEMYDRYFGGKEVEIKRGRFWFGGNRTSFAGSDTKEYKQHLLYRLQNRTAGIYEDKVERFYREDFIPTKILSRLVDPYLEERRLQELGTPLDKSEQLFTEIPIIGELLSNTVGQIIKPTIYYGESQEEINPFLSSVDKAIEDIKTWGGYQGYAIGAASGFLFGGTSLSDILSNNFGVNTTNLASLDQVTSLNSSYEDLQLGGLFGITEPIRRILTSNDPETTSNMSAQFEEEWFQMAISERVERGEINNLDLIRSGLTPGKNYEERFGLASDEVGKYGMIDRMRILGVHAPWSQEYFQYENMAQQKLQSGNLTNQEATQIYQIMSLRDNVVNKDTTISNKYVEGAQLTNFNVGIDEVISYNEFMSGGKRYKLAGIETDFGTLSERLGSRDAMSEMKRLKRMLETSSGISVTANKDALSATKVDEKGEYVEVYSQEISSQFEDISSSTYLATMSGGYMERAGQRWLQRIRNFGGPASSIRNKMVTGRDAYTQFYREESLMPSFRSWEDPYGSFISPMFDLALSGSTIPAETLRNMGNPTAALFSGGLAMAGNALDLTPQGGAYQRADEIQMVLENTKEAHGQNSWYDLSTDSTYNQLRNTLTSAERNLFYSLINEVDPNKRSQIYSASSDRFKRVLDIAQAKQFNYLSNNDVQIDPLDTYNQTFESAFALTNDYFYNLSMAKRAAGYELTSLEKRRMKASEVDSIDMTPLVSEETRRSRYTNGRYSSKIISTIFGNDEYNYTY